jgi:hypothetical protein
VNRVTWLALAIVLGVPVLIVSFPPRAPQNVPAHLLPWQIQTDGHGGSTVLGVHPGRSTLAEAEGTWAAVAELSLFRDDDGRLALEGFFDNLTLAGLKADLVVTLDVPAVTLEALHDRGLRIRRRRTGGVRVQLDPRDLPAVRDAPVASLTYLPAVDLAPELLRQRFGTPRESYAAGDVEQWLYPDLGLVIAVSTTRREVLQFVAPRDFGRLRALLPA